LNALVDLAVKEQILANRGASLDGSYFGAVVAAKSLIEFKHVKYAPNFANATAAQLVSAKVAQLTAASN